MLDQDGAELINLGVWLVVAATILAVAHARKEEE